MSGTYSQILLHIVCSTKRRQSWIGPDMADRLYPYMGGIVRAKKGPRSWRFLRPCRGGFGKRPFSTGCALPQGASLHPWLQSGAPAGA